LKTDVLSADPRQASNIETAEVALFKARWCIYSYVHEHNMTTRNALQTFALDKPVQGCGKSTVITFEEWGIEGGQTNKFVGLSPRVNYAALTSPTSGGRSVGIEGGYKN
jgi:hypothetical protein